MNVFYKFIKNTLCCSLKISTITEVEDSIMFVVFMLLKKSLMFCFIITLAAGITLSFKGRLEGMCVLIWLKLLYNQIVFMGNKIIHESPYKYFKIFFLCCFIVTMTACEISPHMDRFCFMITLYAWVTLWIDSTCWFKLLYDHIGCTFKKLLHGLHLHVS